MRLGVLDVGSNTIHLQVVDAHLGGPPIPNSSHKSIIKLTEFLDEAGAITQEGIGKITEAIQKNMAEAQHLNIDELLAFATSAIREAVNSEEVLSYVNKSCSIDLQVLTGEEEARFTFLAARRWLGWSAGDLLVLDIGGGSLEIARGTEENPTFKTSMQLGAGRLTRNILKGDPFTPKSLKALEEYIEDQLEPLSKSLATFEKDVASGTSKTFRTLAKLVQNLQPKLGLHLTLEALDYLVPELQKLDLSERRELPGVSMERAHQLVAGSMVARQLMRTLNLREIKICPWALREGIVLHRLDWIER
ncbi:MAG: Ppx/GppA family phosphatase [Betaproteobacteria bacterium]|jgi:exopolyphosphatase / guanosine-5'-triphosphate,3'-diphosphate pyrophosphatase|nr:Ppx/GppA family phosphatase [Betaproteobacteria bacterium]